MIRKRIINYRGNSQKRKTLNIASIEECRIFAYYLYEICSYKTVYYPDDEIDDDYLYLIYGFFSKLAKKMQREKVILNYLSKVIIQYQNHKVLKEISGNCDECFCNTQIPYLYEEDKMIDHMRPRGFNKPTQIEINLLRCYYVSHSNEFLLCLIANFLIKKTPSEEVGLLQRIPSYLKASLDDPAEFNFVKNAVGLNDDEIKVLQCCYRCFTNRSITNLLETFSEILQKEIMAKILGFSVREFSTFLRQDSKLRLYGFIDETGKIEDDFFDCVEAQSMQPFFYDLLKKEDSSSCYELESFNVPENTKNLMSRLLHGKESVSLLLYGKPGSGKTEFAKALAKQSGLEAYVFKNERELSTENEQNVFSRLNCLLSMTSNDNVFIIDEADTILQTCDASFFGIKIPSKNKGTVNKMLEKSRKKIIWIVNFTSQIDESTLRRFTYSYKFDSMTRNQIRSITETKLKTLKLPEKTNLQILDLMEKYKVTGASVDNVIKTIKCLDETEEAAGGEQAASGEEASTNANTNSCRGEQASTNTENACTNAGNASTSANTNSDSAENSSNIATTNSSPDEESDDSLVQCVKSVLKENSILINGKNRMRENVSENYDLNVLNTSMKPEQIVKMIQNARAFSEKSNTANDAQNGIRMLFYGVSGTGKTEFARYIAEQLGMKILLKRASDIFSKWVGETEQNIRDAFDEAARTESILLFDEADSFFADRNGAVHNWERTQVNEFLTQMEEFPGILICTTNLKKIMDAAMNRRFHIITEFRPLNTDGIRTLLNRYFSDMIFEETQVRRLERMNSVTPGDFGVLYSRSRFMDESERSADYIMEELCKIQEEKEGIHKTIGFSVA